ncbi:hypothetical protein [Halpernia frigidisoli]|uniref:Uncharacterized protein n=1 Tax=Halpernia frigidisoli TaxID=1125876 RepID=A0A1I3FZL6_9FLAO|nr:hypothetical protein [Halpernia frigidisoli]SFI16597.1 hypothetical protein SAMN05443292_1735 [Halpernia frigidisoli]
MKKVLLLAAFGVAGLMSANQVSQTFAKSHLTAEQNLNFIKSANNKFAPPAHQFVPIQSPCGQVYYLDLNQYSDDAAGLIQFGNDINYFNEQKCGSGGGFQGQYT